MSVTESESRVLDKVDDTEANQGPPVNDLSSFTIGGGAPPTAPPKRRRDTLQHSNIYPGSVK